MSKKDEALKLALEALERHAELGLLAGSTITAIREALADSALDRMAENARELGLDYEPPCKTGSQCTSKCQQCEQPAQQQEPMAWMDDYKGPIPLFTKTKSEAEAWGGNKIVPLYTTPPAATVQEPVAFNAGVPPLYPEMKDGETISVEYTTPPTEPVQETSGCRHKRYSVDVHEQIGICYDCGAEGRMRFVVGDATPPAAQQQWVGLTDEEIEKMAVENGHATFLNDDEETGIIWFDGDATPYARAIEQKLREKNGGAA